MELPDVAGAGGRRPPPTTASAVLSIAHSTPPGTAENLVLARMGRSQKAPTASPSLTIMGVFSFLTSTRFPSPSVMAYTLNTSSFLTES